MSYNAKNYTEQGGETTHFGGKVVFSEGATVEGFPLEQAGTNKLGGVKIGPGLNVTSAGVASVAPATNAAIGGVKVGSGLNVTDDGVLSAAAATAEAAGVVKMAANQSASTAVDVAGVVADLNTLIVALKTAGIMAPDAAAE